MGLSELNALNSKSIHIPYASKKISVKWIDDIVGVMATHTTNVGILFVFRKGKIDNPIKYKLKILETGEKKIIICKSSDLI